MILLTTLAANTSPLTISDLGAIVLPAHSASIDLEDYGYSLEEVLNSADIKSAVQSGLCFIQLDNKVINIDNAEAELGDFSTGKPEVILESTNTKNNTDLVPGTYIVNSTAAVFDITLDDSVTPAEWFFICPYANIETNNVTIKAGTGNTFTDEDGIAQQEDLVLDSAGIIVTIVTFDHTSYVVTVSAIRATNPNEPTVDTATSLEIATEITSGTTATVGDLIPVDTRNGSVTVTAPSTAVAGNKFGVVDSRASANTNSIVVTFGAANFAGGTNDYVLNTQAQSAIFTYINSTIGWINANI